MPVVSISGVYVSITWTYPTDIPNCPTDNFNQEEWLTYFLVSLLLSIIMLSLVVSILSDTYAKVNEHSVVADSQALAQMIYESELLFFWNRNKNQTFFLVNLLHPHHLKFA